MKRKLGGLGERNFSAKLTERSVRELRDLRATGLSIYKLAARFGVAACTVRHVCHRRTWRHVQ